MGNPATPTPTQRAETRRLAAEIVASVVNDEEMPLGLDVVHVHAAGDHYNRVQVETLVFSLASEIRDLTAELNEACDLASDPQGWRLDRDQIASLRKPQP